MNRVAASAFALATMLAAPAAAQDSLEQAVARDYDAVLEELFVDFHENPELSFMETRTAGIIAAQLRSSGAEVTEGVGRTGVVGVMENGPGPVVLVRADMDGLPIAEDSGIDYMSTVRQTGVDGVDAPVMHACGHDVHITSLIGVARQLARLRDQWSGTVVMIAQPAEERISGARAMMEDGLYERFPKITRSPSMSLRTCRRAISTCRPGSPPPPRTASISSFTASERTGPIRTRARIPS